jgi:protein-S-isoprenylcysteine O-methyltransferase Ste14
MQWDVLRCINAVWMLIGLYWALEAVRAKATVKRQSILSSAMHILVLCFAGLLIWDPATAIGILGARVVPTAGSVQWLALAATISGCVFTVWARACLGSNWSSIATVKQDHELILRGPYAVVRHPIYSGLLLALAGTATAVGEVRAFIGLGFAFIAFLLKSGAEEKLMRAEFADEYVQYSQRVKRLIPFVL